MQLVSIILSDTSGRDVSYECQNTANIFVANFGTECKDLFKDNLKKVHDTYMKKHRPSLKFASNIYM